MMATVTEKYSIVPVALVVEANVSLRRLTSTILRQKSIEVIEARTESEAEELLIQSPRPVAMLLAGYDSTGEHSGLELALRLRESQLELRILLFGVFAPTEDESLTMRLAGIHFLSVPFSFGRFSQALEMLHPVPRHGLPRERIGSRRLGLAGVASTGL